MTLENAEIETDLFFVEHNQVYRRGLVEANETTHTATGRVVRGEFVCGCDESPLEGAAEQIAHALNRLPKLERALILAAQALRSGDAQLVNTMADEIEELICG